MDFPFAYKSGYSAFTKGLPSMLIVFIPFCFLNYFGTYGGNTFYLTISYQLNPLKYSHCFILSKLASMDLYL